MTETDQEKRCSIWGCTALGTIYQPAPFEHLKRCEEHEALCGD